MQEDSKHLHNYVYSEEVVAFVMAANDYCQLPGRAKGEGGKNLYRRSSQASVRGLCDHPEDWEILNRFHESGSRTHGNRTGMVGRFSEDCRLFWVPTTISCVRPRMMNLTVQTWLLIPFQRIWPMFTRS